MAATLPTVAHEHHERLLAQVDQMPAIGDRIGGHPGRVPARSSTTWSSS